jgi:hypothetical protein
MKALVSPMLEQMIDRTLHIYNMTPPPKTAPRIYIMDPSPTIYLSSYTFQTWIEVAALMKWGEVAMGTHVSIGTPHCVDALKVRGFC